MPSTKVMPISNVVAGIKAESSFGVAIDSSGDDGTAYRQLPIVQVQKPTFNITRESRLLSGRGLVKNSNDTIINTRGGTVVMPFEMIATPKLLSQHLALVCQEHSEASSTIHTHEIGGQGALLSSLGGSKTNNIPHTVNLAYEVAGENSGEGIRVTGVVCSDLALGLDYGTNGGYMTMSGNYFSGFSNPVSTASNVEQSFATSSWAAPEATGYYNIGDISTKTLTCDDGSAQELVLKSLNFNIANGVNRVGFNSNGDAESYSVPEYVVTGDMTIKMDDNFAYEGGRNVLQDFLGGKTLPLVINIGDGSLNSVGEANIQANIQYTGDPAQDISENGIFHTLAFECVSTGASDNNEAFEIQIFNGESQSAW
tara:strand:- start:15622 stop:16728 length:1107 start_codon:yes stop_codon:yes gene_type:complete